MANTVAQVPVLEYGSREYHRIIDTLYPDPTPWQTEEGMAEQGARNAEARAALPACILVGRFRQYTSGHQGGAMLLDSGTPITGVATGGRIVFDQIIWAQAVYEPETINQIGGKGAYRDVPHTERIAAAIEQATKAVMSHA